jgi:hypothetical protein
MQGTEPAVTAYVRRIVRFKGRIQDLKARDAMSARFRKAFSLLPPDVLDLFLEGLRPLSVEVRPAGALPLGMSTQSEGKMPLRTYKIVAYVDHGEWPEDRFMGAFLRELGHVVSQRPPEAEWPAGRGDRARFKERLEHRADAMVWRWGLRHYGMSYLAATYPPHWVDRIVEKISDMILHGEDLVR